MILKNDEAREKLLEGATLLYDAVATTFGPKGRNVLIKDKFGNFSVTHDGVTVARAVKSDDPQLQMGIDLIKEASKKMDIVGDGTTSVTILTYWLIKKCFALVAGGHNAMWVKKELDIYAKNLIEAVQKKSKKIEHTLEAVYDVAHISAEDDVIAKSIAELVVGTGYEGAITVETRKEDITTFELVEGYVYPGTYASPHFITDPKAREVVLEKAAVILVEGIINDFTYLAPLVDALIDNGVRNMLLVADNVSHEVLQLLIINKVKSSFNMTLVKNLHGRDRLEDLAAVVDADILAADPEENYSPDAIGAANKIVVKDQETIIFEGQGDASERIEVLKAQTEKEKDEAVDERLEFLNGKVGLIRVGGVNSTQADEKKYRIDDAVAATKAALKGGILPGGGVTLRDLASDMGTELSPTGKAVAESLRSLENILLENSGINLNTDSFEKGFGVDVSDESAPVEMLKVGIVDPTIVTTEVIRNAFAVAATAVTVGGAVIEKPITAEELQNVIAASQQ